MRRRLAGAAYRSVETVFEHGEFAVRGAIMDIFPMGSKVPYRIDLFDDEIDTLHVDPEPALLEQVEPCLPAGVSRRKPLIIQPPRFHPDPGRKSGLPGSVRGTHRPAVSSTTCPCSSTTRPCSGTTCPPPRPRSLCGDTAAAWLTSGCRCNERFADNAKLGAPALETQRLIWHPGSISPESPAPLARSAEKLSGTPGLPLR